MCNNEFFSVMLLLFCCFCFLFSVVNIKDLLNIVDFYAPKDQILFLLVHQQMVGRCE